MSTFARSPWATPRTTRTLRLALGLLAGLALLAHPAGAAEVKRGGTLVAVLPGDLPTINPGVSSDLAQLTVSAQIYNTLVRLDNDQSVRGVLAESWEIAPDGKTYTFRLRKGVKWHDGKPFTSADVAHGFLEINRQYSAFGSTNFKMVNRIDTPDEHTVVMHLDHAFPPMMMGLTDLVVAGVYPKHLYEGSDPRKNPRNFQPVGTGPFRFVEYRKGSHVILEANPDYFEGRPQLDKIIYQIVPNKAARVLGLEKGEVDYLPFISLPASDVPRLEQNPTVAVKNAERPSAAIFVAFINNRNAPFSKKEVRQAIYHAFDREEMLKKAAFGFGKVSRGPISSVQKPFYTTAGKQYPHDKERAKQLLDAAGYPLREGVRFKMRVSYDKADSAMESAAQIMKSQLREIGVDVLIEPLESAAWRDKAWIKWDFDMTMGSFSTGPDPSVGIARLYICENIKPLFAHNVSGYCNPQLDKIFDQAASEIQHAKRKALFDTAMKILAEDVPVIWLWDRYYPFAHKKTLAGLPTDPTQWQGFVEVGFTK
jgi:peptide/nickel transport system substrate-binding protein